MSAQPLRRAVLLIVPFTLLFAGCNAGQGKPGVPAGVGETNPQVGGGYEPAQDTVSNPCTAVEVRGIEPCWGAGSECAVTGGSFVPWIAPGPVSPEIVWTYPCAPDHFIVTISQEDSEEPYSGSPDIPGGAGRLGTYSWQPSRRLYTPGRYVYTITAEVGTTGKSGTFTILTDELCEDLQNSPPELNFPHDGQEFTTPEKSVEGFDPINFDTFADDRGFDWRNMSAPWALTCTYWEAQASPDWTFTTGVMRIDTNYPVNVSGGVVGGAVEWCHTYYWRVREYLPGNVGPWSEVSSFRIAPPEGWDTCLEERAQVQAVAIQDSACRNGPSTVYGIAGYASAGERRMIVGRNADGTWYQTAERCYINSRLLRVEAVQGTPFPGGADVDRLMGVIPEVPDPPLPTETAEPKAPSGPSGPTCSPSLSPAQCAAGGWPYNYDLNKCICP